MAVTDLIKCQLNVETAFATAATANCGPADHLLMGVTDVSVNVMDEVHLTERSGHLYPSDLASQVGQMGEGSITMDLSYEDIAYVLNNFFDAVTTTSTTTTTPGTIAYTYYNRAWDAPADTAVTPAYLTFEFGAPSANYEACGVLFNELNISGEAGGIWTGDFPFLAQQINTCTMASLSDSAVELIRMADTTLYVDTWSGTIGTTPVADTLISFGLSVSNGRHLKTFAGNIEPQSWGDTRWSGTLNIVAEFNASAKAYVDAMLARTGVVQRAIRIQADNDAVAAGDGDRVINLDFYGTLVDGATLFSDREGNITVSLDWEGTYNDTGSDWLSFDLKNQDASIG
jgi:hypothetical protein